jgi:hypothetical protein
VGIVEDAADGRAPAAALAVELGFERHGSAVQGDHGGDRLHRRARLEELLDGRVGRVLLCFRRELVRVEGGPVGPGEDLARVGPEHEHGHGVAGDAFGGPGDRLFDEALDVEVDGEHHVEAVGGLLALGGGAQDLAAPLVHAAGAPAGAAFEPAVGGELDARDGVLVVAHGRLDVLVGFRFVADVAEDVGGERAVGVDAPHAVLEQDAGVLVGVLLVRGAGVENVFEERAIGAKLLELLKHVFGHFALEVFERLTSVERAGGDLVGRLAEDVGEPGDQRIGIFRLDGVGDGRRDQADDAGRLAHGEGLAVAVEDAAARGVEGHGSLVQGVGLAEEEVVSDHLDGEELGAQGDEGAEEDRQDDGASDAMDPVRHSVVSPVRQLGGRVIVVVAAPPTCVLAEKRGGRMGGWGVGVKKCLDLKLVLGFTPPILPRPSA